MRHFANIRSRMAFAAIGVSLGIAGTPASAQDGEVPDHAHHAQPDAQTATEQDHAGATATTTHATTAQSQPSPVDHLAPPPPAHAMGAMSGREMTDAMEMDDAAPFAMLRFDRLERADGDDGVAAAWKVAASVGGDFDKLLVRSEGERAHGQFERSDVEALWDHAIASYWDTQLGARRDFGRGAQRSWAVFGVQGLAPYWFQVGATAYVGDAGRTALRLEVDYDLALTQRLILQPRIEVNAYGKDDRAAHVGSGVSDSEVGVRVRYEIARQVAPYFGVERSWLFGESADFARDEGRVTTDVKWVVGVRVWY